MSLLALQTCYRILLYGKFVFDWYKLGIRVSIVNLTECSATPAGSWGTKIKPRLAFITQHKLSPGSAMVDLQDRRVLFDMLLVQLYWR